METYKPLKIQALVIGGGENNEKHNNNHFSIMDATVKKINAGKMVESFSEDFEYSQPNNEDTQDLKYINSSTFKKVGNNFIGKDLPVIDSGITQSFNCYKDFNICDIQQSKIVSQSVLRDDSGSDWEEENVGQCSISRGRKSKKKQVKSETNRQTKSETVKVKINSNFLSMEHLSVNNQSVLTHDAQQTVLNKNKKIKNQCYICGKKYSHGRSLQDHIAAHLNKQSIKCNECNKGFNYKRLYLEHYNTVHLGLKKKRMFEESQITIFSNRTRNSNNNRNKEMENHKALKEHQTSVTGEDENNAKDINNILSTVDGTVHQINPEEMEKSFSEEHFRPNNEDTQDLRYINSSTCTTEKKHIDKDMSGKDKGINLTQSFNCYEDSTTCDIQENGIYSPSVSSDDNGSDWETENLGKHSISKGTKSHKKQVKNDNIQSISVVTVKGGLDSNLANMEHLSVNDQDVETDDSQQSKLTCALCKETFPTQDQYILHTNTCANSQSTINSDVSLMVKDAVNQCVASMKQDDIQTYGDSGPKLKHQCYICGKRFSQKKSFRDHIAAHLNLKSFKCNECDKRFNYKRLYKDHYKAVHLGQKEKDRRGRRRGYLCCYCGKLITKKAELERHEAVHRVPDGMKCILCGKGFSSSVKLTAHEKTHEGKKCSKCNQIFQYRPLLRLHMEEVHNIKKVYPCRMCTKTFKSANERCEHMKVHTRIRSFICDICKKGFKMKHQLAQHMISHSDERPISCPLCGETFKRYTHLKQHTAAFHGPGRENTARKTNSREQIKKNEMNEKDICKLLSRSNEDRSNDSEEPTRRLRSRKNKNEVLQVSSSDTDNTSEDD